MQRAIQLRSERLVVTVADEQVNLFVGLIDAIPECTRRKLFLLRPATIAATVGENGAFLVRKSAFEPAPPSR
ncbi:MAG: hypothetical protein AB7U47_14925, partial [Variibacter sp.]